MLLIRFLKTVYSFSVSVLTFVFDTCAVIFIRKSVQLGGVAIVRLDAIGDFILWLDAAKEFRCLYPNKKITLIANQVWSSLAKLLPYWDEVWGIDRKDFTRNIFYRIKWLRKIRKEGFDITINPMFSREFLRGDAIVRASHSKERIGFDGDLSNISFKQKKNSDKWYTKIINSDGNNLMELNRNTEFLKNLVGHDFRSSMPHMELPTKDLSHLSLPEKYFVITPGGSHAGKLWNVINYSLLINRIMALSSWTCVLCGSTDESYLGDYILQNTDKQVINLIGQTSLLELFSVIKKAGFIIGNDSGSIHLAAATATPSICILGGGHFGRFMPYEFDIIENERPAPIAVYNRMECYGCNWECIYKTNKKDSFPCIANISVEDVWNKTKDLLIIHG